VSSSAETTVFRTCPPCEATRGLELTISQDAVTGIRGDKDDVFSRGFVCPKGTTLGHLHDDPDSVRGPWSAATATAPDWILLHLIEETGPYNGHIHILRERADGVTGI